MEIRKCNEKDIDEIYELICELESERFNYKEFEEAYKNKIIDEKNHSFLIIKDNKIIGLIILIIDYQLHPFAPMLSKIGKKLMISEIHSENLLNPLFQVMVIYLIK